MKYQDFKILNYHIYSKDVTKRAEKVAVRMRDESIKGNITKYIQTRDFMDIVIMPTMVTETLAKLGTKLTDATISVEEMKKRGEYTHLITISGVKAQIKIPLKYDPGWDRFHIIPGFSYYSKKQNE